MRQLRLRLLNPANGDAALSFAAGSSDKLTGKKLAGRAASRGAATSAI
jgi:hypothetical protein